MTSKDPLVTSNSIANVCAALLGGWILNFTSGLDNPILKEYAIYAVPGLTIFIAKLFRVISSLGTLSLTEIMSNWSCRNYAEALKKQMEDTHLSEKRRKELEAEYQAVREAELEALKGRFSILSRVNRNAIEKVKKDLDHTATQAERNDIDGVLRKVNTTRD